MKILGFSSGAVDIAAVLRGFLEAKGRECAPLDKMRILGFSGGAVDSAAVLRGFLWKPKAANARR